MNSVFKEKIHTITKNVCVHMCIYACVHVYPFRGTCVCVGVSTCIPKWGLGEDTGCLAPLSFPYLLETKSVTEPEVTKNTPVSTPHF